MCVCVKYFSSNNIHPSTTNQIDILILKLDYKCVMVMYVSVRYMQSISEFDRGR